MPKKKKKNKDSSPGFRSALIGQLLTLTTSAFGLVAALAWNQAIQDFFRDYIQAYFPLQAIYYKFIYALLITLIAVLITYQLSRLAAHFHINDKK